MWLTLSLNILKKIWPYVLIVTLGIAVWLLWGSLQEWKHQAKTSQQTNKEILRKSDSEQKQIRLEKDTYIKTLEDRFQWVLDSIEKNPNSVIEIQYIKTTREVHDTTEILTVKYDTVYRNEAEYNDCGLSVKVSWGEADSTMSWDITDNTELAIATYKTIPWFKFWKKQQYTTEVVNVCTDSIVANESFSKIEKRK